MIFNFLSSICRRFLVGLARLAGGSSRGSVSTLVETYPISQLAFARRNPGPLSPRPTRNAFPDCLREWAPPWLGRPQVPREELKVLPLCKEAVLTLWQPNAEASRAVALSFHDIFPTPRMNCALHKREALQAPLSANVGAIALLRCSNFARLCPLCFLNQNRKVMPQTAARNRTRLRCESARPLKKARPLKREVVPGGGFEPPTRGFSIRCSTN